MSGAFWILGGGNMGGAMLRGWIAAGNAPDRFTVIDPALPPVPDGVRVVAEAPEGEPETLLLAVKPQLLGVVAPALAPHVGPGTTLISILAGVECATLAARFPRAGRIVRVMPNMPVSVGKGVMALFTDADRAGLSELMAPLGLVEWIDREQLFDAVTALSGCGPAFLFRFVDALARAGAAVGLPADQAARLALATVDGAATLAVESDESPGVLADRVASPGGATREGLNVLDAGDAIGTLLMRTLAAAELRSHALAEAARG